MVIIDLKIARINGESRNDYPITIGDCHKICKNMRKVLGDEYSFEIDDTNNEGGIVFVGSPRKTIRFTSSYNFPYYTKDVTPDNVAFYLASSNVLRITMRGSRFTKEEISVFLNSLNEVCPFERRDWRVNKRIYLWMRR